MPGIGLVLQLVENLNKIGMSKETTYRSDVIPNVDQIMDLYINAGLKRPVEDRDRIKKMFANSNLIITAWDNDLLVGLARSLTDFCYSCYLSDLAVRASYQGKGIGRQLVEITKKKSGDESMLLLLSAPSALSYYPRIGLRNAKNAFIIDRKV